MVGWGNDNYGQADAPVIFSNVIAVAAGAYFSLALLADSPSNVFVQGLNPVKDGSVFNLSLLTARGKAYVLEFENSIASGNSTMLSPLPGDGTMKILTDSAANVPQRFYRVRVR